MANDLIRNAVVLRLNVKAIPGRADCKNLEQMAQAGAAAVQAMPGPGGGPRPGGTRPGGTQGPGGGLRR